MTFQVLRKRPRVKSLRVKAMDGLGAKVVAVLATAAWQGFERFSRPSGAPVTMETRSVNQDSR